MFDYDRNVPIELHEVGSETRDGVTVRDITYASPVDGKPIAAYLVMPQGDAPHAGILWVHWYEPSSPTSNRTQYIDEAVTLAKEGVVSLLPETMWSEPTWFREGRALETDFRDSVNQVVALRRALDVLLAQPGVDPTRIGYVGHDFGAMYGSVIAGVDRRAAVYVLIAGTADFADWFLLGQHDLSDEARAAFINELAPLGPTRHIAQAAPAFVFFQFGDNDPYVPLDVAAAYVDAASQPKQAAYYATGHDMEADDIHAARLSLLRERLGLQPPRI